MPRKQQQTTHARVRKPASGPKAVDWAPAFLAALAETCHCARAAEAANISYTAVWRRRKADTQFDAAYKEALQIGGALLEAEAVRRAKDGLRRMKFNSKTGEAYIDPETGKPYIEHEYSDTLLLALLKRHFPDLYRERTESKVEHSGNVTHTVLTAERQEELMEKKRNAVMRRLGQSPSVEPSKHSAN